MEHMLPVELAAALRRVGEGRAGLAERASRLSTDYRQAVGSSAAIRGADDAIAYALSRMPATYAAVAEVLAEVGARTRDFAPATILDAGAGPGTASWAAHQHWPEARATLVEQSEPFLALARTLAPEPAPEFLRSDFTGLDLARRFDLVTLAYALTELSDTRVPPAIERLWGHCSGILVIVEPGRPREYQRLMQVRQQLIALGARIVAPCPHENECPLVAPDWCHFSVRLPRSRDHMRLKGGTLGYEDEKFSYLVVARQDVAVKPAPRIIKPPVEGKAGVVLEICGPEGIETRSVASRDRAAVKAARKLRWGDAAPAS